MSRAQLLTLFAGALVVLLVLTLPLRLALGWTRAAAYGLSAAAVEGTLWNGRLVGARLGGVALGDLRAGLSPGSLLAGAPMIRVRSQGIGAIDARIGATEDGIALRNANGRLPLAALVPGLGLAGALDLTDVEVEFRDGRCRRAGGRLGLQEVRLAGVSMPGLRLSGDAACRDGRLVSRLSGQAAGVVVEVRLQVDGAGRYRLDTSVRVSAAAPRPAALASGFRQTVDGYVRTDMGRLGGG